MRARKQARTRQMVEEYTAQVPSIAYLGIAAGGILLSATLAAFSRNKTWANFVGLWVPTIMLIGVYNKLVKLEGSDESSETMH